jgi:glycosyltransferase involved in cell wall biosynthesis
MLTEFPLVTVIASCYNHEKFVVECLEGIRAQTYSNIQLIITDDCSTDQSVEVISNWIETHQAKCSFVHHKINVGFPKTLNEVLRMAEGKYISIISADDIWLPEFIENHVKVFEDFGESIGVVYGRSYTMDEQGNRLPETIPYYSPNPEGNVLSDLLNRNFIPANTVMIRRSCYNKAGYYDEDLIGEGYDMWLRIAKFYQFKFSPEILSNYRVLPSSLSHSRVEEIGITKAKVYLKQLCLYPEYVDLIDKNLTYYRDSLYSLGHPLAKKYLWLGLLKKPSKTDLLMSICAFLGLPYSAYLNIHQFLNKRTHAS